MPHDNHWLFGFALGMILAVFMMVSALTFDYFSTKYRPVSSHQAVCDDQWGLYYFIYDSTPTVVMNRYQRRQWCPPTLTPTFRYKSPTPDRTVTPACAYPYGGYGC